MSKRAACSAIDRRSFILGSLSGLALLGTGTLALSGCSQANSSTEKDVTLPPLPYREDALEPYISKRTIEFHYGKHHRAYVEKTNKLIEGSQLEDLPLQSIITETFGSPEKADIFNNAAQSWNHDFYWRSLDPDGGEPQGEIKERIDADFGSYDNFKKEFLKAATGQFGSGWAWLVLDGNKLKVTNTPNAENPLVHGQVPLLTADVWEHAYYLDYQNRRNEYIQAVIDHLLNWKFASLNLVRV